MLVSPLRKAWFVYQWTQKSRGLAGPQRASELQRGCYSLELCRLGLATLSDIRLSFEIEMKRAIPDSVHIPVFEVKLMLGHTSDRGRAGHLGRRSARGH